MSNFHLKTIYIQNFRSIKKVNLEIKDGLYAVIGKNSDQPSTTNGSGKSSVPYALWWCLTGTSLGGETLADDVVNIQEGKDCRVECTFDSEQGEIVIMRCRKDKEHGNNLFLTINGQDLSCHKVADTQERINQLLKVSFDVLKSTIILTADMKAKFSDLTPQGRVSLLESIRDYTIWEKVRAESNVDIKTFDAEISEHTAAINQMQGSINAYNSLVSDLRVKYVEEKNKVDNENAGEKLKTLQDSLAQYKNQLQELQNTNYDTIIDTKNNEVADKNTLIQGKTTEYNANVEEINSKYKKSTTELNETIQNLQNELNQNTKDIMSVDFDIRNLRSNLDIIQKWFTNDTCPTCNRKLDRTPYQIKLKNNEKEELLSKVNKLEDKKAQINAKISAVDAQKTKYKQILQESEKNQSEELKNAEKTYQDSIKNIKEEIDKLNTELNTIKTQQKDQNEKKDKLNTLINQTESQIAILGEQKNSTENRLQEIQEQALGYKKEVDKLEEEKEKIQKEINKIEKKKLYAKFFYDSLGPKGNFRGVLLAKDIAFINQCIKTYIPKFFSNADLHLTTPTAEKNVIDMVFEEDGVIKPVTSLSEGEKKRINLITQMAIYDLVQSTSLFNFNLCIFDEIESALDPEGVRQLLEVIDDRQDNFNTAWWITNNEMVSSNILNKILATKKNGFTKVEYMQ